MEDAYAAEIQRTADRLAELRNQVANVSRQAQAYAELKDRLDHPDDDDDGFAGGVREPRRPRNSPPSLSVHLELVGV